MSELRIKNRSERDLRSCEVYQKMREKRRKGNTKENKWKTHYSETKRIERKRNELRK